MVTDECWAVVSWTSGDIKIAVDRNEIRWHIPNDMTPTAWKTPLLTVHSSSGKSPRDSCGTEKP